MLSLFVNSKTDPLFSVGGSCLGSFQTLINTLINSSECMWPTSSPPKKATCNDFVQVCRKIAYTGVRDLEICWPNWIHIFLRSTVASSPILIFSFYIFTFCWLSYFLFFNSLIFIFTVSHRTMLMLAAVREKESKDGTKRERREMNEGKIWDLGMNRDGNGVVVGVLVNLIL